MHKLAAAVVALTTFAPSCSTPTTSAMECSPPQAVSGCWWDTRWPGGAQLELEKGDGYCTMTYSFADGSTVKRQLQPVMVAGVLRLEVVECQSGDFFVVDDTGALTIGDVEGIITTIYPRR